MESWNPIVNFEIFRIRQKQAGRGDKQSSKSDAIEQGVVEQQVFFYLNLVDN